MESMLDVFTNEAAANGYLGPMFYLCVKVILVFNIALILYIFFVGPILGFAFFYLCVTFAALYKYYWEIKVYNDHDVWIRCWNITAKAIHLVARIWHGYEVIGLEKIPRDSGVAFVIYHSTLPLDFCYLTSKIVLERQVMSRILAHHSITKVPGASIGLKSLGIFTGPYEKYVDILKNGGFVIVAPGGALEAIWSDSTYKLLWGQRTGFARGAIEAKVPIIPVFAQNSKEAFGLMGLPKGWSQYIYDKYRIFIGLPYGGLPVKMRIILGDPIPHEENITAEDLAQKVSKNLERLIAEHQRIPGNMLMALLDRIWSGKLKQK